MLFLNGKSRKYLLTFMLCFGGIPFTFYLNSILDNFIIDDYEEYRFPSFSWIYDIFYTYELGHTEANITNFLVTICLGVIMSYLFASLLNKLYVTIFKKDN